MRLAAFAIMLAVAAPAAAQMPWAGYTTEGLHETRKPWQFNWDDPENEWLWLSTDSQKSAWFIQLASDLKTHTQPITSKRVWLKMTIDPSNKSERAYEAKALMRINCSAETFANEARLYYMRDNSVQTEPPNPPAPIVPGSMAARVAKRVCSQ